jgi:hypothetical protein
MNAPAVAFLVGAALPPAEYRERPLPEWAHTICLSAARICSNENAFFFTTNLRPGAEFAENLTFLKVANTMTRNYVVAAEVARPWDEQRSRKRAGVNERVATARTSDSPACEPKPRPERGEGNGTE